MNSRPSCVSHGAALYHGQPVRNVLWHRVWGCTKEHQQPSQPASQPCLCVTIQRGSWLWNTPC